MAVRTTDELVRGIIETEVSISDLTPFIQSASMLVDKFCEGVGYQEQELEMIERWLSAHFYAIRDPRRSAESAGSVAESYQYRLGLHLQVTTYGQMAMILDYNGGLAALNASIEDGKTGPPDIAWLGK